MAIAAAVIGLWTVDAAGRQGVQPPSSLVDKYPLGNERLCCSASGGARPLHGLPPRNVAADDTGVDARFDAGSPENLVAVILLGVAASAAVIAGLLAIPRRRRRAARQLRTPQLSLAQPAPGGSGPTRAVGAERSAVPAAVPHSGPQAEDAEARALGYILVPDSGDSQNELEARVQIAAIEQECRRRRLPLGRIIHDQDAIEAKGSLRPGLGYALDQLAAGEGSHLIVSRLDRLSHSIVELGALFEWFLHSDATLVVADLGVDTADETGRLVAKVVVSISGWERNRLATRTRRGLAAAREKGQVTRPAVRDIPALKEQIVAMRKGGMTLQAIADQLNADEVPTLRGGSRWRPSSVQSAAGYKRPPSRKPTIFDLPPMQSDANQGQDEDSHH